MDGLNMNDPIVINKVLKNIDLNPEIFLEKVSDQKTKDKLRKLTDDALKKNIWCSHLCCKQKCFGQDRHLYAIDEVKINYFFL